MPKILLRLLASGALAVCATAPFPVQAASIFYKGSTQMGSILAQYTIETDGKIGLIDHTNILSFSTTLSDALSSYTYGTSTGAVLYGELTSSATHLSILRSNFGLSMRQNVTIDSANDLFPGAIYFGEYFQVGAQISDAAGTRNSYSSYEDPIATVIVSPTPAVPEPATWGMMILGMGAIGYKLRRRRTAVQISYAA